MTILSVGIIIVVTCLLCAASFFGGALYGAYREHVVAAETISQYRNQASSARAAEHAAVLAADRAVALARDAIQAACDQLQQVLTTLPDPAAKELP